VDIGATAIGNPPTAEVPFSVVNIAQAHLSKSSDLVESLVAVPAEKREVVEERRMILQLF